MVANVVQPYTGLDLLHTAASRAHGTPAGLPRRRAAITQGGVSMSMEMTFIVTWIGILAVSVPLGLLIGWLNERDKK